MYCIIVYDVEVERVSKVCKFLRQYLHWIQNSVFEGKLNDGAFKKMRDGLEILINKKSDSLIIFTLKEHSILKREVVGREKNSTSNII
jgi:CRISPR-associated protein Cas2